MKMGVIQVLQGACEKDEAVLRNQAVVIEGLGGCQA